jgi:hypothetical protein
MSTVNFIPEIVSAQVETAYAAAQIVIPTLNHDHEGEAKSGNAVRIVGSSNPTIVDYKAAGRKFTSENLNPDKVTLLIDQEKGYSFLVDDVDAAQAAGSLEPYTREHGEKLAEDAETHAIADLVANGTSINVVGSAPVKIDTAVKAKNAIKAIRTALTKAKVPVADRFVVVNPDFADLLLEGLSDVNHAGSDESLRNGQVTRLYGLTVLESPCFPADLTVPTAVGYHSKAASFVSQLNSTEALRSTESAADIVRGLNVYGSKVTRPAGVVVFKSEGTPAAA